MLGGYRTALLVVVLALDLLVLYPGGGMAYEAFSEACIRSGGAFGYVLGGTMEQVTCDCTVRRVKVLPIEEIRTVHYSSVKRGGWAGCVQYPTLSFMDFVDRCEAKNGTIRYTGNNQPKRDTICTIELYPYVYEDIEADASWMV